MQLSELSDDPELRLHPDRAGFSSNDMELDPIQDRFIFDRTSVGGPSSECFEVCFAGSVDVGVVYESDGTNSTESTSIWPPPTRYRPPGFTCGRRHRRNDTVMSPDTTESRSSRLNSTDLPYGTSLGHSGGCGVRRVAIGDNTRS
jgi:hypothetical protein